MDNPLDDDNAYSLSVKVEINATFNPMLCVNNQRERDGEDNKSPPVIIDCFNTSENTKFFGDDNFIITKTGIAKFDCAFSYIYFCLLMFGTSYKVTC